MKKFLIVAICALVLVPGTAFATGIAIGDANYLGFGVPFAGDQDEEMAVISELLGLGPNGSSTIVIDPPPGPNGDIFVQRSGNLFASLLEPTMGPKVQYGGTDGPLTLDVTGYAYLFNKYGGTAHVWVVAGLSSVTFDTQIGQGGGLSHYSLYGTFKKDVPDGGATLMLLGGALVGLGALRRKLSA